MAVGVSQHESGITSISFLEIFMLFWPLIISHIWLVCQPKRRSSGFTRTCIFTQQASDCFHKWVSWQGQMNQALGNILVGFKADFQHWWGYIMVVSPVQASLLWKRFPTWDSCEGQLRKMSVWGIKKSQVRGRKGGGACAGCAPPGSAGEMSLHIPTNYYCMSSLYCLSCILTD